MSTLSHPFAKIERMYEESAEGSTCNCGRVAASAAFSYQLNGHGADITAVPWADDAHDCDGRFVFIPDLHRIDFVADAAEDFDRSILPLAAQVDAGWEVWAVVPLSRLADAHDAYRDRVNFVQGWWQRVNGEIAFTDPEVP